MAKLTYKARKRLPARKFAVDGKKRKYPITDRAHAANALSRVSAHGTPAEKKAVRAKACAAHPTLPSCKTRRKGK